MWKAVAAIVVILALLCCVGGAGAGGWWWWTQQAAVSTSGAADDVVDVVADAPVDHLTLGKAAYDAKEYEQALREFDALVLAEPKSGVALSWRGRTYAQLELLDRAEPDLDEAARRLATDLETWRSLGWVRAKREDDEGAIRAFDEAIRLDGKEARLYVDRGNAYFRLGNRARALDDATRACDLGEATGCTLRDRISSVSGR